MEILEFVKRYKYGIKKVEGESVYHISECRCSKTLCKVRHSKMADLTVDGLDGLEMCGDCRKWFKFVDQLK